MQSWPLQNTRVHQETWSLPELPLPRQWPRSDKPRLARRMIRHQPYQDKPCHTLTRGIHFTACAPTAKQSRPLRLPRRIVRPGIMARPALRRQRAIVRQHRRRLFGLQCRLNARDHERAVKPHPSHSSNTGGCSVALPTSSKAKIMQPDANTRRDDNHPEMRTRKSRNGAPSDEVR
jgi:hypothetical protein